MAFLTTLVLIGLVIYLLPYIFGAFLFMSGFIIVVLAGCWALLMRIIGR